MPRPSARQLQVRGPFQLGKGLDVELDEQGGPGRRVEKVITQCPAGSGTRLEMPVEVAPVDSGCRGTR